MINQMLENGNYSHILLLGDFNFPQIDWKTWTAPSENVMDHNNIFIETTQDHYLYKHIDKPTRGRINQQSNTLDLIFTNEEDMVLDIENWSPLGKSDH